MKLTLAKQAIELIPSGALLGPPADRWLVTADVHLGKSAAFRARGLAIPEGDTGRDLARLDALVRAHSPARLVIAGDLFHSPTGLTPEIRDALACWLAALPCPVTLITGNHDARVRDLPETLDVTASLALGSLTLIHDPADQPDGALIAGHLHPVARIADSRRSSLRLPCFHLAGDRLILPAFGSFTGGHIVKPAPGDRIFVFPGERIIEVPPQLWR